MKVCRENVRRLLLLGCQHRKFERKIVFLVVSLKHGDLIGKTLRTVDAILG